MIQCILHTFYGILRQQIRMIQNKEYARDRRRRHTNWPTKVTEETKQKVTPQLLVSNIPKSELHSVCEVSMSSISLFYVFFFQIGDLGFKLKNHIIPERTTGKKYLPVNGDLLIQRMYHLYLQRNEPEVWDRQQSILM